MTTVMCLYRNYFLQHINKDTVCLCISEGSLIPFFAASLGAKKVFDMQYLCSMSCMINAFLLYNDNLNNLCIVFFF